jgi:hypothetical protein
MGAEPFSYTVPYDPDIQAAREKLRRRDFESKKFNGAEFGPPTPEAAFKQPNADGTREILDISRISDHPTSVVPPRCLPRNSSVTLARRSQPLPLYRVIYETLKPHRIDERRVFGRSRSLPPDTYQVDEVDRTGTQRRPGS